MNSRRSSRLHKTKAHTKIQDFELVSDREVRKHLKGKQEREDDVSIETKKPKLVTRTEEIVLEAEELPKNQDNESLVYVNESDELLKSGRVVV